MQAQGSQIESSKQRENPHHHFPASASRCIPTPPISTPLSSCRLHLPHWLSGVCCPPSVTPRCARRIVRARASGCCLRHHRDPLLEDWSARRFYARRLGNLKEARDAKRTGLATSALLTCPLLSTSRLRKGEHTKLPALLRPVEMRTRRREGVLSRPSVMIMPFVKPRFKASWYQRETERADCICVYVSTIARGLLSRQQITGVMSPRFRE